MRLSYEYTTRVEFRPSIGQHNILLRCLPAKTAFQQSVCESFWISRGFWHKEGVDGFGNRVISGGTSEWHPVLEYSAFGEVDSTTYCIPDAEASPMYLLSSPMTRISREILFLLPRLTGNCLDDCMTIVHAVHQHIAYMPGTTNMQTTAEQVCRQRQGVCQDYAHLMIALCRAAGYHARYVCGFMQGEGHTHAWVEVHDGQCWYAFDPTNDTAIATGYIKIAHGRDVCDCPVSRGSFIGNTIQQTEIIVKTKEI